MWKPPYDSPPYGNMQSIAFTSLYATENVPSAGLSMLFGENYQNYRNMRNEEPLELNYSCSNVRDKTVFLVENVICLDPIQMVTRPPLGSTSPWQSGPGGKYHVHTTLLWRAVVLRQVLTDCRHIQKQMQPDLALTRCFILCLATQPGINATS